uniref:Peptidase A1 domain-containing protein n=1 Tax=Timema genevievae TaxID=629358 RepID=A0A7R9PH10_TIMGE|nr:unnamed protein product [Timema genevievae]
MESNHQHLLSPQFVFIEVNVNTSVPFCANGCDAIIDTSTTVISGPAKEVDRLNTILVAVPLALGRYKVNCATVNKLPEISFLIGGKNFTLKARNYIQQISWGGFELCLSAFVATDLAAPYDNLWALGAAFIGQYYTEFDLGKNRIGFAESYQ